MEVTFIDKMGDDLRVANAARVSFHKEHEMFTLREDVEKGSDEGLIEYLAKHDHWTPFSHVQITLREKVPIFVARQRFKHMVGFTYNEVSRRYVDDTPEFYVPDVWRARPEDNKKQGSSDKEIKYLELDEHLVWDDPESPKIDISIHDTYLSLIDYALQTYELMISNGVAPEQARMVLPQAMYTEFYSTGSLVAWARMINLRKDGHAQKEIQDLARMCDEKIRGIKELNFSWEALVGKKWY